VYRAITANLETQVTDWRSIMVPELTDEDTKETGLCLAAACNNCAAIQLLLKYGAQINLKGNAVTMHRRELGKRIQRECEQTNLHSAPDCVMTPLDFAICYDSTEALRLLLEHGANPNLEGSSSLGLAVAMDNVRHAKILIRLERGPGSAFLNLMPRAHLQKNSRNRRRFGGDVHTNLFFGSTGNRQAQSLLAVAVENRQKEMIEVLGKAGARAQQGTVMAVQALSTGNAPALSIAIGRDDVEIVRLLLKVCLDCDPKTVIFTVVVSECK
tara:strand:- start:20 stop:829 length:810 start_codon:yes stop_codon:yes gene_type:complete